MSTYNGNCNPQYPINEQLAQQLSVANSAVVYEAQANRELSADLCNFAEKNEKLTNELAKYRFKERSKISYCQLAFTKDAINVNITYTSNMTSTHPLSLNLRPPLHRMPIECYGGTLSKNYVLLIAHFTDREKVLYLCTEDDLENGAKIEKILLQMGAIFTNDVSAKARREALETHFLSSDSTSKKYYTWYAVTGWGKDNRFHSYGNTPYDADLLKGMPIKNKFFPRELPTDSDVEAYLSAFRTIGSFQVRLLLLCYMFTGLLHTLFSKLMEEFPFYLNLMFESAMSSREIASLFQIYSRDKVVDITLAKQTEKALTKAMQGRKDDVFILDARAQNSRSNYDRQKCANNVQYITQLILNGSPLDDGCPPRFSLVVLSDTYSSDEHAINLLLQASDIEALKNLHQLNVTEKILAGVVDMVEQDYDFFIEMINKFRNYPQKDSVQVLKLVYYVFVRYYFCQHHFDLDKELGVRGEINWSIFQEDTAQSEEDQLNRFVEIIRANAAAMRCAKRTSRVGYLEKTVYYNDKYLDFPKNLLHKLFASAHCTPLLDRMLRNLRSNGYLVTDSERSLTLRVQHENRREEFYRIPRDLFDRNGDVPLLDLMEEVEYDAD